MCTEVSDRTERNHKQNIYGSPEIVKTFLSLITKHRRTLYPCCLLATRRRDPWQPSTSRNRPSAGEHHLHGTGRTLAIRSAFSAWRCCPERKVTRITSEPLNKAEDKVSVEFGTISPSLGSVQSLDKTIKHIPHFCSRL